ncbi:MAG TPA: glutathione-disulfide reductase [Burkholderiaceae bacterium]|nr:glutathione-disulfide reductase [Burkholderiaceae bacterium]
MYDYDLFTIGAGSGGVRASRMSAALGARVAVAENRFFGGTCVNVGCIPKKLFTYAAHYHEDFEDAAGYGWTVPQARFDWPTLVANKDREIRRLNGIYEKLLTNAGCTVLRGHARIVDPHTVEIDGRRHTAAHILVATGSKAQRTRIPGAELGFTSDEAFHLPSLPERVVVYGGGYIAVEFASIFNGLGVDTTLVYRGERLVRVFDADIGRAVEGELAKKGVRLMLATSIDRIDAAQSPTQSSAQPPARSSRSGPYTLALRAASGGTTAFETDGVMFATGRVPLTDGLGLGEVGVGLTAGGAVQVDRSFRSNVPSILAIGDVIGHLQLTPVALAEGMMVADHLFGSRSRRLSYDNVPTAIYCHPNIGTVGLSEEQARAAGHELRIFKSDFRPLKHTVSGRDERTWLKLVVDAQTDRVLGLHMVGPDAGEIVQGFAVAMNCGATKAQFDATIGIHPTLAEEFVTMREPVA